MEDVRSTSSSTPSFWPSFIDRLDVLALASLATTTRQEKSIVTVKCSVVIPPITGSHNVVFPLAFSDGVKWVAKVPIMEWSPTSRERFRRDIIGMQFLLSKTKLPVPEIHGLSPDCDNPLGRPYVILSHVEGTILSDLWFDPEWFTESHRRAVFRSLAQIMSTLAAFEFPHIGQLDRDPDTQEFFIGPIFPSAEAIESGSTADHCLGPYASVHAYLLDAISQQLPSAAMTTTLAELALLRTFAATLPELTLDGPPFVLSFPDYGYQNIFVDRECNVTGLIDWDDLTIGPRQSGFARYPSWITRDWDPMYYGYQPPKGSQPANDNCSESSNDVGTHSSDCESQHSQNVNDTTQKSTSDTRIVQKEDSPETLALFREEYLQIYTEVDPSNAKLTHDSHILEALEIAIARKSARPDILGKLSEYVFNDEDLNFYVLSRAISEGKWLERMVGREKLEAGGKYI